MRVEFTLNDQTPNYARLQRLVDAVERSAPSEIVDELSDKAVEALRSETPIGRTGKIRGGWKKSVTKRANEWIGEAWNTNESDAKGAMIVRILEHGAHYKTEFIYPSKGKFLRFTGRTGDVVFARKVRTKNRPAHRMVEKAAEYIKRIFDSTARRIIESHIRRSIG